MLPVSLHTGQHPVRQEKWEANRNRTTPNVTIQGAKMGKQMTPEVTRWEYVFMPGTTVLSKPMVNHSAISVF